MSSFEWPPSGGGGGGGGSPTIGLPVIGGDPNDVLFIDPSGNLGQDDFFQYLGDGNLNVGSSSGYGNINVGSDFGVESDGSGNVYIYSNFNGTYMQYGNDGTWKVWDNSGAGYLGLDGSGHVVIQRSIFDTSGLESIDPNKRILQDSASNEVFDWNKPNDPLFRNIDTWSINGLTNGTTVSFDDSTQTFDVNGVNTFPSSISFTPGIGIGPTVDDFSVTGTYTDGADSYTVVLNSVDETIINADTFSGPFTLGETVTGSISGVTFTVDYTDNSTIFLTTSLSGSFTSGDVLTGSTSGSTANWDSTGSSDWVIYQWSDSSSGPFIGIFENRTGAYSFSMNNGITGNFRNSPFTMGNRHANDRWTFSYSPTNLSLLNQNFSSLYSAIGDWSDAYNGVYMASNVGAGENQVSGNLDMQNSGRITNLQNGVDPYDAVTVSQASALAGALTIGADIVGGATSTVLFEDEYSQTLDVDTNFTYTNSLGSNAILKVANATITNDTLGNVFFGNGPANSQIELDSAGNIYLDSSYGTVALFDNLGNFTAFNSATINDTLAVNGGASFNSGIIEFNPSTYPVQFSDLGLSIGFYGAINESGSVVELFASGDGGGSPTISIDASTGAIQIAPGTIGTVEIAGTLDVDADINATSGSGNIYGNFIESTGMLQAASSISFASGNGLLQEPSGTNITFSNQSSPGTHSILKLNSDGSASLLSQSGAGLTVSTTGVIGAPLTAYASDAAAGTGGLTTGQLYQTSGTGVGVFLFTGVVMVKQ